MSQEVVYNRFESYKFKDRAIEYVAIHDEDIHFENNSRPQIKLCSKTLRVRANDLWTKLPRHVKEMCVAHEMGHRELNHVATLDTHALRIILATLGNSCQREMDADRFGTRLIGKYKYLHALKDYLKIISAERGDDLSIREIKRRIKELSPSEIS